MPLLVNLVLEVLDRAIRKEKDITVIQIRKEVKLSVFADDMIPYMENPKEFTKKLLGLINEFSKVAGFKINIQKPVVFLLYINNKLSKKEIKKTNICTIAPKKILRNKLIQGGEKSIHWKL